MDVRVTDTAARRWRTGEMNRRFTGDGVCSGHVYRIGVIASPADDVTVDVHHCDRDERITIVVPAGASTQWFRCFTPALAGACTVTFARPGGEIEIGTGS